MLAPRVEDMASAVFGTVADTVTGAFQLPQSVAVPILTVYDP